MPDAETGMVRLMRAEADAARLRGAFAEIIDVISDTDDPLAACMVIEQLINEATGESHFATRKDAAPVVGEDTV